MLTDEDQAALEAARRQIAEGQAVIDGLEAKIGAAAFVEALGGPEVHDAWEQLKSATIRCAEAMGIALDHKLPHYAFGDISERVSKAGLFAARAAHSARHGIDPGLKTTRPPEARAESRL